MGSGGKKYEILTVQKNLTIARLADIAVSSPYAVFCVHNTNSMLLNLKKSSIKMSSTTKFQEVANSVPGVATDHSSLMPFASSFHLFFLLPTGSVS